MPSDWIPNGGGRRGRPGDPLEELRRLWEQVRGASGGGGAPGAGGGGGGVPSVNPWIFVAIAVPLWLLSGIFIVAPDERGVVLRFGRVVREADSGPGYHLPWPIEEVLKPAVTQIRKEEFGFRSVSVGSSSRYNDEDSEALMVTGDENIVKLEFIVQYRIKPEASGATDFLFNIRDPEKTVRDSAEAAMREVIGRNKIDDALTEGKDRIQNDAQVLLQSILDRYDSGIEIATLKLQDVDPPDQVADAFKDVISAQQDRERLINESRGYANDVVPKARGQAAQLLNEADAYAQSRVTEAEGDASRFVALHQEYQSAVEVTRTRLWLETIEEVLGRSDLLLLDESVGKQVVPYLPLDQMHRRPQTPAASASPAAPAPTQPAPSAAPRSPRG
ncbi:MAG: FtsH protease activity modulator HflK [Candidatus Binatia bacterium]